MIALELEANLQTQSGDAVNESQIVVDAGAGYDAVEVMRSTPSGCPNFLRGTK